MFGKELIYTIVLDKELKNSNNGQTRHWSASHRERKEWTTAVNGCWIKDASGCEYHPDDWFDCDPDPGEKIGMIVTRFLGKRQRLWDPDSVLRGNAKQCIDALIAAGVAVDDSPAYVDWVIGIQDDSNKEAGPYTTVEIYK